jgi:hypothetical protein
MSANTARTPIPRCQPLEPAVAQAAPAHSPLSFEAVEQTNLVDATALAADLGVSRQWIYEHRVKLGALRLGDGPRPRLRFDPIAARAALSCYASPVAESEPAPAPHRRRPSQRPSQPGSILAVRPRKVA